MHRSLPALLVVVLATGLGCGGGDDTQPATTAAAAVVTTSPPPTATVTTSTPAPATETTSAADRAADRKLERDRKYLLGLDDLMISLETAVNNTQHGAGASVTVSAASKVTKRISGWLLNGRENFPSLTVAQGAASNARTAAQSDDQPGLARAHRDIADARNAIADDLAS